ncbi:MAG: HEAT repeat domain-containing protein [Planctomycetota bacterium]|nr:HEAT repeat domain-containing protein [Planctomycetota bacterium]
MKHHSRYFVLMLGLMLLVCPSTFAEEDVNDRLNRFQQAYSRNRVEALNILNPVNHPRIVDTIATVYGDENTQQRMTYEATYMKADEILKTATGDEVFERMHYYMQKKHAQRVRQHFVRVLGQLADERTFPELVKLVYRENEPDIQFEMARAIANYNTDDAFIAMYKLAKDALNVNISLIAFRGLQRTNNEKTSELLRKLYDSRKAPGQVRGEALSTLYKRNDDFALNKAKEALDDEATAVRVAAIQIAVENDRSDLKDKFIMMLAAPEWEAGGRPGSQVHMVSSRLPRPSAP